MVATQNQIDLCFQSLKDAISIDYEKNRAKLTNDDAKREAEQTYRLFQVGVYLLESFMADVKRIAEAQQVIADAARSESGWANK